MTSPVIEFLDGKSWGVNGEAVGYMRQVGLNIIKMQYGTPQKDSKVRIGLFEYDGKQYTLKELIAIAREYAEKAASYSIQEYEKIRAKLKTALSAAIEYFINTIEPFMGQANGAKKQVVILIEEWAEKRNRQNSELLHWAETEEGKEFDVFKKNAKNFEALDDFCTDLVCFLGDLMRSCPKANKQFEKLKDEFLAQQR